MSALATDTVRLLAGSKTCSFKIKNAVQVYVGSFCSIDSTGYLIPFAGAAQEKLVGRALATPDPNLVTALLGNTSAVQVVEATVCMDEEVLEQVAVTGVAAITDLKKVVFLNSTDNDLTLTRPARGVPFGTVVRWWSSTTCDVLRFSASELDVISLGGNGSEAILVMSGAITDLTSNDFTIATPPYRGKIRSISATVVKACTTGAAGSVTLQPKIAGTLTTGGVVTINTSGGTGGTAGDVCAGTSITALNAFSESDTLKVTATLTSTFTAGSFNLYAIIDRQVGI
jgi:hypothetical protein